ncbi:hypothetical protein LDENG_00148500 [Lucifuga dentata]|nr:hypothetical protein LDENG_00148500 [Lucifuga dentata]
MLERTEADMKREKDAVRHTPLWKLFPRIILDSVATGLDFTLKSLSAVTHPSHGFIEMNQQDLAVSHSIYNTSRCPRCFQDYDVPSML